MAMRQKIQKRKTKRVTMYVDLPPEIFTKLSRILSKKDIFKVDFLTLGLLNAYIRYLPPDNNLPLIMTIIKEYQEEFDQKLKF